MFDSDEEVNLKIVGVSEKLPFSLSDEEGVEMFGVLVVSENLINKLGYRDYIHLFINSNNASKLEKNIENYLIENKYNNMIRIFNIEQETKSMNAIVLVISIFLYGFITVITLIGVTNIFNTITTNMMLRSKEFANLKSIGMTKKEFNRMIRLESIFYGLKSLIIGIPVGILVSWLVYRAFSVGYLTKFVLPYKAIIISILFVTLVVGIIMKYSVSKINKQNIIETIRNDNV